MRRDRSAEGKSTTPQLHASQLHQRKLQSDKLLQMAAGFALHQRRHPPWYLPTLAISRASTDKTAVIILPVTLHTLFTALIVYIDLHLDHSLGLPSSIVPSLSIVVGLMLVFRNSSSYDRYWSGRNMLQSIVTSVRNLTRSFLVCGPLDNDEDRAETEKVVGILVAILYAVKNHLRGNWGIARLDPQIENLVPKGLVGHEAEGLGLPLELAVPVERYIKRGVDRGAFNAPQSAMLSGQLNTLIEKFGSMETIK